MAESTTGYDFPTMMQQFYNPKSARGSRLGRGPALASTMVQYGYGTPGTNVTVSPTFSNIGNPTVVTEGLSIGDVALGDFGSNGGAFEPGPTPGTAPRPTGGTPGEAPGGSAPGKQEPVGTTLKTSAAIKEALQKAAQKGQSKDPRVTRSELRGVLKESDKPKAIRNAIEQGEIQVGGKATDFLNRQLEKAGARSITPTKTESDEPKKQQPKPNETTRVVGLVNKAGVPGTTNLRQPAPEKPKQASQAAKSEAKKRAEAKANSNKKK